MGAVKRDLEEITSNKADEIAEQRYGREFSDLPASEQIDVWMEAENKVKDQLATENDAIYDQIKENGATHWDELELMRRLGK